MMYHIVLSSPVHWTSGLTVAPGGMSFPQGTLWPDSLLENGMTDTGPTWLFYDGDCRICAALARWVDVLDVRDAIVVRPLQQAGGLLAGVPGDEILDAMRAVSRTGQVREGGEGLLLLVAAFLDGEALETILFRSPSVLRVARRIYALLVEFRGHLVCRIPASQATLAGRSGREGP